MDTTKKIHNRSFSPSVNISRDRNLKLDYIPSQNSRRVYSEIIKDYEIGIRAFSIIGSYGIGKSSFLWALEKSLNSKQNYFNSENPDIKFEYHPIVGEYNSFINSFAKSFGFKATPNVESIFKKIDQYYSKTKKKGLLIVIDEFGKFLEYASKNMPEKELYFIQLLAEYVNNPNHNIILITTLHQDFNGYAMSLTRSQQNEWTKVKGRLKEIAFQEPVEQLLSLSAKKIKKLRIKHDRNNLKLLFKAIEASKVFPLKDYLNEEVSHNLAPFDILSAAALTIALQKYGQNERSLFTFLESKGHLSLFDYDKLKDPYYNLSCVYDYLTYNYHSFISSKYNPDYSKWAAIRSSVERTESICTKDLLSQIKIVKTLGLLNIFSPNGSIIDKDFLCKYSKYSLGIKKPDSLINELEKNKIIRFVKHNRRYILFEGTDLDIELAIDKAGHFIERISNVVDGLNKYFNFPFILAKATTYSKGTPRYFAFHLSESPESLHPEREIDGYINLIFSEELSEESLKAFSKNCTTATLFGVYKNTEKIKNLLFEIEKIKKVKEDNIDDRVAVRELNSIYKHQINLLNYFVFDSIYSDTSNIVWYFKGVKQTIKGRKSLNTLVSKISDSIYQKTPIYRNEMVNKTKLSSPIQTAKRNLLSRLTEEWNKADFGFEDEKYPPEKTIYLSLIKETGIHYRTKDGYGLGIPKDNTFTPLWEEGVKFITNSKNNRKNLQDLFDIYLKEPYKLKRGFLDFWVPIFLFTNRDSFALFNNNIFIPNFTSDIFELIIKKPRNYEIKAYNFTGIKIEIFNKYKKLLNLNQNNEITGQSLIETIKPFLVFYRQLPQYARTTSRLSKDTLAFRSAIQNSTEPDNAFFETFPQAFGYDINKLKSNTNYLEEYISKLQKSITELRTCYDLLINRFEDFIAKNVIGDKSTYSKMRDLLQQRYRYIKEFLLLPDQKVFYARLYSKIDDKNSWLNSLAQPLINKSLELISDKEENILYERFSEIIHELDNMCELNEKTVNKSNEIVYKIEIANILTGLKKDIIRFPKSKTKDITELQRILKQHLTNDYSINVATLTYILEELLEDGKKS